MKRPDALAAGERAKVSGREVSDIEIDRAQIAGLARDIDAGLVTQYAGQKVIDRLNLDIAHNVVYFASTAAAASARAEGRVVTPQDEYDAQVRALRRAVDAGNVSEGAARLVMAALKAPAPVVPEHGSANMASVPASASAPAQAAESVPVAQMATETDGVEQPTGDATLDAGQP